MIQNGTLIHTAFVQQARLRPDALALSSSAGAVSYGALDRASLALATRIAPGPGEPAAVAAILAERGPALVVAMLACARAGRPFVVLDLAYPAARLQALLAICRPSVLLLAGPAARGGLAGCELPAIAVELDGAETERGAEERLPPTSPDDPAYILFTSGSTGAPKAVACSHRPLVHFTGWQARTFGLGAGDRFTLLSGLSHDPVMRDVFTPLSLGAAIHIPDQATLTAPGGLHAWFAATRPTVAHLTPPLGRLLTTPRGEAEPLGDLRYAFFGGDVLRGDLVEALEALAPACEAVNFYGATETPQAVAFHRVPRGAAEDRMPIGQAVDRFEITIRDEAGHEAADGAPGEIVVRSPLLTLGYMAGGRLPEPRPGDAAGEYGTGDIGLRRADGRLVLRGRRDDQVKVRGHRVELAEIGASALKHPGVAQAIALNIGAADAVRIACFVEPAPGAAVDGTALARRLRADLPAYMVPETVTVVGSFPLLPNGKIDREALKARRATRDQAAVEAASTAELTPARAALMDDWRGIFPGHAVTAGSSFAALGGDSLSYVTAYLSLEQALGEVPDGWTTLTLAQLTAPAPAAKSRLLAPVESAIAMRALAISAVVASHFQLIFTGGGAASALVLISGFIFGGLQLGEAEHQGSLRPIGRLLKGLLLPVYLIELPQIAVKFASHYHAHLSSLLLSVDLIDFTGMPADGPNAYGGHEYLMWYVDCLFHIILIYAALLFICRRILKLHRPVEATAIAAVLIGLAARFVLPAWFLPRFGAAPVDGMSIFAHSPTAHLATFALAALAGYLKGRWRVAMIAPMLVYALFSAPTYGAFDAASIALVAGVLLLAPKLRLPRVLVLPIYSVAGASLFIYLLQFKFLAVFSRLHLPMALAWAGAVAGGVAVWRAWNWAARRIGTMRTRVGAAAGVGPGPRRGYSRHAELAAQQPAK